MRDVGVCCQIRDFHSVFAFFPFLKSQENWEISLSVPNAFVEKIAHEMYKMYTVRRSL